MREGRETGRETRNERVLVGPGSARVAYLTFSSVIRVGRGSGAGEGERGPFASRARALEERGNELRRSLSSKHASSPTSLIFMRFNEGRPGCLLSLAPLFPLDPRLSRSLFGAL
jgi:hypothetical protein